MPFLIVLLSLFLVALGILLHAGKCPWLIAGYNTASPAEKAKIDEKALGRCVGKLMFFDAGCFLLIGLGGIRGSHALLWSAFCLMLAGTIAGVIYMNTGNRFQKRKD